MRPRRTTLIQPARRGPKIAGFSTCRFAGLFFLFSSSSGGRHPQSGSLPEINEIAVREKIPHTLYSCGFPDFKDLPENNWLLLLLLLRL